MTATEARQQWSEVLNRAGHRAEPVAIHRNGKAVAVVISPEDYARYQELLDAEDVRVAKKAKRGKGSISFEDLKSELGL